MYCYCHTQYIHRNVTCIMLCLSAGVGFGFVTDYTEGGPCVRIASRFNPDYNGTAVGNVEALSFIGEGESGVISSELGFELTDPDSANLAYILVEVKVGSSVDKTSDLVRARCNDSTDTCSGEVCNELIVTTGYNAGIYVYEFR